MEWTDSIPCARLSLSTRSSMPTLKRPHYIALGETIRKHACHLFYLLLASRSRGGKKKKKEKKRVETSHRFSVNTHSRYHSTLYVHKIEFVCLYPSFPFILSPASLKLWPIRAWAAFARCIRIVAFIHRLFFFIFVASRLYTFSSGTRSD